ncbi:hypothetical protein B5M09_013781 [Aphanomyces astaci]|uniref:Uncharacterized protein n=1 Tax=Aphanomyces astaci TaxID=112090 RepID=A0A425DJY6_APHAT|nr:hypothetical protein B5M09_013781 [Aphanomyces astaci]
MPTGASSTSHLLQLPAVLDRRGGSLVQTLLVGLSLLLLCVHHLLVGMSRLGADSILRVVQTRGLFVDSCLHLIAQVLTQPLNGSDFWGVGRERQRTSWKR